MLPPRADYPAFQRLWLRLAFLASLGTLLIFQPTARTLLYDHVKLSCIFIGFVCYRCSVRVLAQDRAWDTRGLFVCIYPCARWRRTLRTRGGGGPTWETDGRTIGGGFYSPSPDDPYEVVTLSPFFSGFVGLISSYLIFSLGPTPQRSAIQDRLTIIAVLLCISFVHLVSQAIIINKKNYKDTIVAGHGDPKDVHRYLADALFSFPFFFASQALIYSVPLVIQR